MRRSIALAAAVAAAGCGDPAVRRIRLTRVVPAVAPDCGAPPGARTLTVAARGEFAPAEDTGAAFSIEDGDVAVDAFPAGTRWIEVRVEGSAGTELAIGRTREFVLDDLPDGAELRVFMAPRRGACPVGPMAVARAGALAARAGAGVLVAGGVDDTGAPVDLVEWYDPDAGAFAPVDGSLYAAGLAGASMTTLADGRVVVAGGPEPAYQVYDPAAGAFGPPLFLERSRAHHAAAALPDGRLLLAGGCRPVGADGDCSPDTALADSIVVDVDSGVVQDGPGLAVARIGAAAVVEADGRVLVAGGIDATGAPIDQAERLAVAGGANAAIGGAAGAPVRLASGAVLSAFASAVPSDAAAVVPPGTNVAVPLAAAPAPRADPTATALEDGTVLIAGGDAAGTAARFAPARGEFDPLVAVPPVFGGHVAVRLDDGAVLIAGGRDVDGTAVADAWVFRPDLTGRYTAQFNAGDPVQADSLTPRDPSRVVRSGEPLRYVVSGGPGAGAAPSEWAVAAGPEFAAPIVVARAGARGGGVAILFGYRSERDFAYVALQSGEPARAFAMRDGQRVDLGCAGPALAGDAVDARAPLPAIEVRIAPASVEALIDGERVLACDLADELPAGHVGIGVIGGVGAAVDVESLVALRR
ncbi:MAG: hypothetical protein D6689_18390 [Deltaproteobacteria bacterium]|nr:MAG: hypothetical protein D6689_18390 [Deltaproteobacteria bacterium]